MTMRLGDPTTISMAFDVPVFPAAVAVNIPVELTRVPVNFIFPVTSEIPLRKSPA